MTVLVPKGYQRIAETYEQYKKVTATVYKRDNLFLLKVVDHISGEEKLWGPFDLRQIEVIDHVFGDVMWKAGIKKS